MFRAYITCSCFIYQLQIPDLELHPQQVHQLLLSKSCHHKMRSYCKCNSFAPKTPVGLGMRQKKLNALVPEALDTELHD